MSEAAGVTIDVIVDGEASGPDVILDVVPTASSLAMAATQPSHGEQTGTSVEVEYSLDYSGANLLLAGPRVQTTHEEGP